MRVLEREYKDTSWRNYKKGRLLGEPLDYRSYNGNPYNFVVHLDNSYGNNVVNGSWFQYGFEAQVNEKKSNKDINKGRVVKMAIWELCWMDEPCYSGAAGVANWIGTMKPILLDGFNRSGDIPATKTDSSDFGSASAAGVLGAGVNAQGLTVKNSTFDGDIVSNNGNAGGLISTASVASVSESLVIGDVSSAADEFAVTYAGGLVGGGYGAVEAKSLAIKDSFFGGNVSSNAQEFAFAGGLVGGITDHIPGSNQGQVSIDNTYVVGNAVAASNEGGISQGSVVGYSINEPTVENTYVDFQELTAPRYAIGNFLTVAEPEIGDDS
jgi:hypothetical protein